MKFSTPCAAVAAAFQKANSTMPAIAKDATNPEFNSKYAKMDAIIAVARPHLAKHDLCIAQGGGDGAVYGENGAVVGFKVETTILHSSGEWLSESLVIPLVGRAVKGGGFQPPSPQSAGLALSYARRFGITAILSITADDDDDGNRASRRRNRPVDPFVQESRTQSVKLAGGTLDPQKMPVGQHRGSPIKDVPVSTLRKALHYCREQKLLSEEAVILAEITRKANDSKEAESTLREITKVCADCGMGGGKHDTGCPLYDPPGEAP